MSEADATELLQLAIWVSLVVCAPVVIAVMAVGVAISLLQALTQIQEVTLTFVPKIVVALIVLTVGAPYMGSQIGMFADTVYSRIESISR
ncbi:MAG TPA: flagellar biosynthetic protein FliQ [Hyphomicrobium sp.]|nr:flagellar biosynthetic protein FliQ [Hyphomicrobium sp.]